MDFLDLKSNQKNLFGNYKQLKNKTTDSTSYEHFATNQVAKLH